VHLLSLSLSVYNDIYDVHPHDENGKIERVKEIGVGEVSLRKREI
jgi:hypothetical protein